MIRYYYCGSGGGTLCVCVRARALLPSSTTTAPRAIDLRVVSDRVEIASLLKRRRTVRQKLERRQQPLDIECAKYTRSRRVSRHRPPRLGAGSLSAALASAVFDVLIICCVVSDTWTNTTWYNGAVVVVVVGCATPSKRRARALMKRAPNSFQYLYKKARADLPKGATRAPHADCLEARSERRVHASASRCSRHRGSHASASAWPCMPWCQPATGNCRGTCMAQHQGLVLVR